MGPPTARPHSATRAESVSAKRRRVTDSIGSSSASASAQHCSAISATPRLVRDARLFWVPMCLAQIGGLTVATVETLVLVPVFYAIAVEDLRVVSWRGTDSGSG